MALIKCPECGHDVSTKAYSCPNCGYVLDEKDIDMHKSNDISDNAMDDTDDIEVDILQDINIENKDLDINTNNINEEDHIVSVIEEDTVSTPETNNESVAIKKKNNLKIVFIIISIILIAICVSSLIFLNTGSRKVDRDLQGTWEESLNGLFNIEGIENFECKGRFVFDNGTVKTKMYIEGTDAANVENSGTYTIEKDEIVIKYKGGGDSKISYSYKNGKLELQDGVLEKVD